MNNSILMNETFSNYIKKYISSKNNKEGVEYNSYEVIVIRKLAQIYDELDIINPYITSNDGILIDNLCKYGYPKEKIDIFFDSLEKYYQTGLANIFVEVEKMLIDMFVCKNKHIEQTEQEINSFKELIYSSKNKNPLMLSYNYKLTNNSDAMIEYFESEIAKKYEKKEGRQKETLNLDAYQILNYSLNDIENMSAEELDIVNKKVYNYFNVNENAINRKYLLDKEVANFFKPKYGLTGNGYVNILFFLAILATAAMCIVIFTLLIK